MKIEEHYTELGNQSREILAKSLKDNELKLLSSNHAFLNDFSIWLEVLKGRPEYQILENAIKEYQMAILSNNMGLYQQAYMGLRFFLERTLVAILFSANEIELNLWKMGDRDTYWSELMDNDKGIFSHKFCKAFFIELKDEIKHFKAITEKVYRECSEYVHGNKSVIEKIPQKLAYSQELFDDWNTKADIIKRVVLFGFCLRYLKSLEPEQVKKVETIINDEFKGIKPINDLITV